MPVRLNAHDRAMLLDDVVSSCHDLADLMERHRLSPEDLAAWGADADTRQVILGLCAVMDMQAKLTASRYRVGAVTTLITLATGAQAAKTDEAAPPAMPEKPDVARRAALDLLKLDIKLPLPPAPAPAPGAASVCVPASGSGSGVGASAADEERELRELLYEAVGRIEAVQALEAEVRGQAADSSPAGPPSPAARSKGD